MKNMRIYRCFTWIMFILCVEMMVVSVLPHHHHHHHVCFLHDSEYYCSHEGEEGHHDADPEEGNCAEETCITNFCAILPRSVAHNFTPELLQLVQSALSIELYKPLTFTSACVNYLFNRNKVPLVPGISSVFSLRGPPTLVS